MGLDESNPNPNPNPNPSPNPNLDPTPDQVLGLPSFMGSAGLWPYYLLLVLLPAGLQLP